jgi:predicted esterase
MSLSRVFIHGLESSSCGTKATFFKKRYADMIVEDFHGTLDQRMGKLNALLSNNTSVIIVGSSFGGLMAAIFACENPRRVIKLILLAPALTFQDFEPCLHHRLDIPVTVYHGKKDDVISVAPVYDVARKVFADLTFHTVDDDHVLKDTFPYIDWDTLLETGSAFRRA